MSMYSMKERLAEEVIEDLAASIADWRASKGFVTPAGLVEPEDRDQMLGKLMLVVTELAEAAEAVRHNDPDNFAEELADAMIRLLDIAGTCEINIGRAINDKMAVNRGRPQRHGKTTTL